MAMARCMATDAGIALHVLEDGETSEPAASNMTLEPHRNQHHQSTTKTISVTSLPDELVAAVLEHTGPLLARGVSTQWYLISRSVPLNTVALERQMLFSPEMAAWLGSGVCVALRTRMIDHQGCIQVIYTDIYIVMRHLMRGVRS